VRARDTLELVKLTGTVKNGQIVVEGLVLPEGTSVTVTVNDKLDRPPIRSVELDANGELIMTPELEAELAAEEREADRAARRGELIPWEQVRETLFKAR
jgi:hypothetical protein